MAYSDTTWTTGDALTASLLNNAETQYDEARQLYGRYHCHQTMASGATITTGSWTTISWNGTESASAYYDTDHWEGVTNPSRFTCQVGGVYWVGFQAGFENKSTDYEQAVLILLNGSTTVAHVSRRHEYNASVTAPPPLYAGELISLSATNYLEFQVWHAFGSDSNISSSYLTHAWMIRV